MTQAAKQVTLSQMQTPQAAHGEVVPAGFNTSATFELMQRQAKMLAASTLVPETYRGNLANCVIALEMASRVGASPLMVMQNLYIVHGTPAWSAKFLIASFNQCGRFSAIRYEWFGEAGKDNRACKAWAVELATKERVESPLIDWALIRAEGWDSKKGSKWKTMPEKMFMYRAAAWLIDTVAPEISMGLQTADQVRDTIDLEQGEDGAYQVTTEQLSREKVVEAVKEEEQPQEAVETKAEACPFTADELLERLDKIKTMDEAEEVLDIASSLEKNDFVKVHKKFEKVVAAMEKGQ